MPPKRAVSARAKGNAVASSKTANDDIEGPTPPPKPDIIDEGTREYYLIQISDLEYQVARYQKKCDELEVKAAQTQTTYDQMITDRDEIIHYLEALKRDKTNEVERLKVSYEKLQKSSAAEQFDLQDKIYKLRNELQDSKDRMAAEQIVLGAKLTALDEYRQEQETSEMERAELEERLKEVERKHADYVYETEKKHVIGMDKLKREMLARLAQLAGDYTKAVDGKLSRQAKRVIRENVAANSQLVLLSDETTQLLRDNERSKRAESELRVRLSMMESLEHQWAKKLRSNARIVGMLSTKCGQQMALVDNYKLQVQQERSKCSKHRAVAEQLESLRHEMSELKGERATLCDVIAVSKQQLQQLSADNASLHQIISDASQVLIRTLQPAAREDCAETSIDVASKRENVLEQLLTILNSDNLRQPTSDDRPHEEGNASGARQHVLQPATELSSLRRYEPGDLGFIPRANERLCSRVDSMRWMSASLSHQMVGRLISRSAATQTPSSWSQSTHRH